MDPRRLADVRAGTEDRPERGGTGYLIGRSLVITARHVIVSDKDAAWPHIEVRLGHPRYGNRRRIVASLAWRHAVHDVALLRVGQGEAVAGPPVRWGVPIGRDRVEYSGLGYPKFADYQSGRGVEQLGGWLPPLAAGVGGGYVLDQAAAPEAAAGRSWPGVSGAAVFCQGLLTGVVVYDDEAFANRRLHAIPADVLLADAGFASLVEADTGVTPVLEPVELKRFFQPSTGAAQASTPGSLLAAAVEAVDFTGREDELATLSAWRDGHARFSVLLVTGEGGQGKTRLAREFAADARRSGWVTGFLAAASPLSIGRVGRDRFADVRDLARRLAQSNRPAMIIADYAETHPGDIAFVADQLVSDPPAARVRLLLLARAAGSWWDSLADALAEAAADPIQLPPLTGAGQERRAVYATSVLGLARHLATLPDPPLESASAIEWDVLASQLAADPPSLDDPRLSNALTLQITALTDLLTLATGQPPLRLGNSEEQELVRHERGYLHRAAERHGLLAAGVLSDRTNPDDLIQQAKTALDRALAALILLGPCGPRQAKDVAALASRSHTGDVARLLSALYPSETVELTIGPVQPDRLAELLLGPILIRQPGILDQIAGLAEGPGDAQAMLSTLARTAGYPEFIVLDNQTRDLITSRPDPFAVAAPVLAATLSNGNPLREGLLRLGEQNPQAFKANAYAVAESLPRSSIRLAFVSASITELLTSLLRTLADGNPDAYQLDLARYLSLLASRLGGIGQWQGAVSEADESVELHRLLPDENPRIYRSDLAGALMNLTGALDKAGRRQEAVAAAQEAANIYRELAQDHPDAHRPDLAGSLANVSATLREVGQLREALATAQEAADIYRELAQGNPDAYQPGLAMTLSNLSVRLATAGSLQEALVAAQKATGIYRDLAENNPAYRPDLGASLTNLGDVLVSAGQPRKALAYAQESAEIYRQIVEENPNQRPLLAMGLSNLSGVLADAKDRREAPFLGGEALILAKEAIAFAQEAVEIYRELAQDTPHAYQPRLAGSLVNVSAALAQAGQLRKALAAAKEAAQIYRKLTKDNPDAYQPRLALALNNVATDLAYLGRQDEALAFAQEVAEIYKKLAESNPDAYLTGIDLATSLANLARRLRDTKQPGLTEVRTWLTRAAEAGGTEAQFRLGLFLYTMLDPPQLAEARIWYTRAAEAGHTEAQCNLGWMLCKELNPPELNEGRAWLTRAAEAGNLIAQYNLGVILAELDPPDLVEARSWLTRAAEAGNVDAQVDLGILLATMLHPPELAEARTWWTRAASAGHARAIEALGYFR
jgi:TPR repeat protein